MRKTINAFREFYGPWSWTLARRALWNLAAFLGIMGLIAYAGSAHYYLILPTLFFLFVTFSLLYKFEQGYRMRRFEKGLY
jgi:hypothetical protein